MHAHQQAIWRLGGDRSPRARMTERSTPGPLGRHIWYYGGRGSHRDTPPVRQVRQPRLFPWEGWIAVPVTTLPKDTIPYQGDTTEVSLTTRRHTPYTDPLLGRVAPCI